MTLQCNASSHWMGTYTEWSLCVPPLKYDMNLVNHHLWDCTNSKSSVWKQWQYLNTFFSEGFDFFNEVSGNSCNQYKPIRSTNNLLDVLDWFLSLVLIRFPSVDEIIMCLIGWVVEIVGYVAKNVDECRIYLWSNCNLIKTFIKTFLMCKDTSNGSWCIGIKGEMSGTVCVTFTWDIYIYMSCL